MKFTDEPWNLKWRKRFAFLPVIIGRTKDGMDIKAWLEFYEIRYPSDFTLQRRAVGSSKFRTFCCTE